MTFDFYSFQFVFAALDTIRFPPGQPGNILRGAFGKVFRALACDPDCAGPRVCRDPAACPYAKIFEPASARRSPSGLRNWPRPFVFRAAGLDGKVIPPEERFCFEVNLFETRHPPIDQFEQVFMLLAKNGLGPDRGRANLLSVEKRPISVSLDPATGRASALRVEFITPTELKSGDALVTRPDFNVLFARARDRVSTLRALYGPGPLEIDFRDIGQRAAAIRTTRCELRHVEATRRSSRTGQVHSIGGFVGVAEYEGDLNEFIPYLEAASWTGVGRQCGWGKGEIRLEILSA